MPILALLTTMLIWALAPLFWREVSALSAPEQVLHRGVWAVVILLIASLSQGRLKTLFTTRFNFRQMLAILASALMLTGNWTGFLYAITVNQVAQASLGYFMCPLLTVALGAFFLREKIRTGQAIALGFAALGNLILIFAAGIVPWIAFLLAFSFAFYALLKKISPLQSLELSLIHI